MKAARLVDGEVRVGDVDDPQPGPAEALVRLAASGVCHSDLHIARGDWRGVPKSGPLGHEAIGVVEAVGVDVTDVAVGDRVILGLGGSGGFWCGTCPACMDGRTRHCSRTKAIMGTFAEQICVWAPSLVVIPDTIADSEAPLACGGLTAYGAVKKLFTHGIAPGSTVGIVGAAGGLGHYAVQIANAFGYRVVGVDVGAERLAFVETLGCERVVAADTAAEVAQRELGGVDAVLVFAAKVTGFELGLKMLRRGGLFVAVGIPPSSENLTLNLWELFRRDPTIIYSATGTVQEMRELITLAADGKVRTHVSRTGSLADLDGIFDDLEVGAYLGRAVLTDLTR